MRKLMLAAAVALWTAGSALPATAAGDAPAAPAQPWSFNGIFGTFDRAAVQRGFQVYKEVCASCHAMHLLSYRHLQGAGFSEDDVKAIAASVEVTDGPNDAGEMFQRPGRPSDRFVRPFPNDQAARAAMNGALPPDLSVMVKARAQGADYVFGLLTGYAEPPAGVTMGEGMNYNKYFPGHQIAMAPPLNEGAVTYTDGTTATVAQMARDVTYFMAWAAEPELEQRKRIGLAVLIFLIVFTGLAYASKRKVWADVH
ncbi:MAG: cytochrome c1 [Thalassobaculales bacterium]